MRVYLDACCLNRLTDHQDQQRIAEEAEAVEGILRLVRMKKIEWLSSIALEAETNNNPDAERKYENQVLMLQASRVISVDSPVIERAKELEALGYGSFDALHLSSAEAGGAEVLFTTDDRFIIEPSKMVTGARSVTPVEDMTDEQFKRYSLELLLRELGPDGLARFLRLNRSGKGDYTRDRDEWQADMSVADIVASLNPRE